MTREKAPWRGAALRTALLGVAISTGVTAAAWLRAAGEDRSIESAPVHGVWLGMGPDAVRAAFVEGSAGRWSQADGCLGESLEWTRSTTGRTRTSWARFEFHEGLLVAIRLLEDGSSDSAPRVTATPDAVTEVRPGAEGSIKTTVLSRACDTHRAEALQMLARQGGLE